jgi:hypothetical protein
MMSGAAYVWTRMTGRIAGHFSLAKGSSIRRVRHVSKYDILLLNS